MMNIHYLFRRVMHRLRGRVVHLYPQGNPRGNVLISYTTLPYLDRRQIVLDAHTNRWECMQMARTFLAHDYAVDVIDNTDEIFVPRKPYVYFLDEGGPNMERVAPLLNLTCIKIFYGTTCHRKFLNDAEKARLDAIEKSRGVRLPPVRELTLSRAIDICDAAIILGNDFTVSTYQPTHTVIKRMPLSTTHTYPSPQGKNFEKVRHNFIWFGGAGLAHKGVDLILEAFAAMPEYQLTLVGKISPADPFVQVYKHEMYELQNIKTIGWLDPGSARFKAIYENALGIVYPSCSEGCAGSVVVCMHAGLIPIVSRESGVETGSFGVTLQTNTVRMIQDAVKSLAAEDTSVLRRRALDTWRYARSHHTRERFTQVFGACIDTLEKNKK